jgi:hypothetical protein
MSAHRSRSARWPKVLLFVLLLEPTRCGVPPIQAQVTAFPPAIIITHGKTPQGFPYFFGGVSSNEREVMEQRGRGYNVKLVFAEKSGSFISGVTLVLTDIKGAEMVSLATDGPWFYIQLPPGGYAAKATFKGETKQIKNLRVTKDNVVQQVFIWDLGEPATPQGELRLEH